MTGWQPSELEFETYMRGECHIHALAAHQRHGGGFIIAYDRSEPYFSSEDGDDDVDSVIHVWSTHLTADGALIARDILGDRPVDPGILADELERIFPDLIGKFQFEDIWLDLQATLQEVSDLSGDEDHTPLCAIRQKDIDLAAELPSVAAPAGSMPPICPKALLEVSINLENGHSNCQPHPQYTVRAEKSPVLEIVPESFFEPMWAFLSEHPHANAFQAFMSGCDWQGLSEAAMRAARERGVLEKIPGSEERGFPHGISWNNFVDTGAFPGGDAILAQEMIRDGIFDVVSEALDQLGEPVDPKAMMRVTARLLPVLDAFLHNPVIHPKETSFPGNTGLYDPDRSPNDGCRTWLVQMRGWSDLTLHERTPVSDWVRIAAPDPEKPDDTPSP